MRWQTPLLALACTLVACSEQSEPAHLRLIDLVHRSDHLIAHLCREGNGHCTDLSLRSGQVTRTLDLRSGRYRFEIRSPSHPRPQLQFTYGLGSGEYYGLALYGIDAPPIKASAATRIWRVFGGIEQPRTMSEELTRRMISMRPESPSEPAKIRIVNLAPGTSSFSARVDMGSGAVSLGPVAYGALSAPATVDRPRGRLSLMVQGSAFPLASRDMKFPPGSNSVIYISGLNGSHPQLVTDRRSARTP